MKRFLQACGYFCWFTAIIVLDRITKSIALYTLDTAQDVTPFLQWKLVFNRGVSWGMFHSEHDGFFLILSLAIAAIIVLLGVITLQKWRRSKSIIAEVALLAGALSNMLDRYLYGGVVDFIHVHIGDWSWPIFNVADMVIVISIIWILWEHKES